MAEGVVELLEAVEVEHEHRGRALRMTVELGAQGVEEPAAVAEAGQLVGPRETVRIRHVAHLDVGVQRAVGWRPGWPRRRATGPRATP